MDTDHMMTFSERKALRVPGFLVSQLFTVLLVVLVLLSDKRLSGEEWVVIAVVILIGGALWLFFRSCVLEVRIDGAGVHYRYPPFLRRERFVGWEDITHVALVRYKPLKQFGGWGFRKSRRYGRAYTTEGDLGLYFTETSGTMILLGIRDMPRLQAWMREADVVGDISYSAELTKLGLQIG